MPKIEYIGPVTPKVEYVGPIEKEKPKKIEFVRPFNEEEERAATLKMVEDTLSEVVSQTAKPAKTLVTSYVKEGEEGLALMKSGISDEEQSVWQRGAKLGLGALQYTMSPITALAETTGQAVEEAASSFNEFLFPSRKDGGELYKDIQEAKKIASKFEGKLGKEAVFFVPIGSTIRAAMMGKQTPGFKAALKHDWKPLDVGQSLSKKEYKKLVEKKILPPRKPVTKSTPLREEVISRDIIGGVTDAATNALNGKLEQSRRIFRQIADRLNTSELNPENIPEVLQKFNLKPADFAKEYLETVSRAGSVLGMHGQVAKKLKFVFKNEPEALGIIDDAFKKGQFKETGLDLFLDKYKKVDNFRRSMLVGQVATAVRNYWSQTGRTIIGAVDASMQAMAKTMFGGPGEYGNVYEGFNTALAVFSRLRPKSRARLADILEKNSAVLEKMRLFSAPVHEVQLGGKISSFFNALNKMQEHFFRKIAFEAKLRSLLKRRGLDFNTVSPKKIRLDEISESVNYSLEMTFASAPKSKAGATILNAYNSLPGMTLINPFPRFNWFNAIPFIAEHSPYGLLKAVSPKVLSKLAKGDSAAFAKHASRGVIGTMMLDYALRVRSSKHAGTRWYEWNTGKVKADGSQDVVDLRAYAPFSTYLFIAEALTHPERLKPMDYASAVIGLNRVAGTGLVVLDWLRANTGEQFKNRLANFAGQIFGGFFVPMRTASDVYSAFDDKESLARDSKESPFIAPVLMNLPKLSQLLPYKPSPVKTDIMRRGEPIKMLGKDVPAGIFRQLTGITKRNKSIIEKEIDDIGMGWQSITPRTGIPRADRIISGYMGKRSEIILPKFISTKGYKQLSDPMKRVALAQAFKEIRSSANKEFALRYPQLALEVAINRQRVDIKEELKNRNLIPK